ncbi:MAG: hypothetical protein Fur0020_10900 [Thermodesulfovibrionia bacterium]
MKRLEDEYKDDGLKVVWLGFQDRRERIMDFMIKHGIESGVGYDERNLIANKYGIVYGAGLVVIDKDGIVQRKVPRGFTEDELIKAVEGVIHKTRGNLEGQR